MGGTEIAWDPLSEVSYEYEITIDLKDADGFLLRRLKARSESLDTGKDHEVQGVAADPIPVEVARRAQRILVESTADKCTSCY
jgi:hypothetical protein